MAVISARWLISSTMPWERPSTWRCQFPCFSCIMAVSVRTKVSAVLKIAVTRNTEMMIHRRVMRFCRLRTLAEMGIRLK